MNTNHIVSRSSSREHGFVLATVLIFLVILTLLGLAAMRDSTMQERMAGNQRDRNLALQAAELALRDAERDLSGELASNGSFGTSRPAGERGGSAAQQDGYWSTSNRLMWDTWPDGCNHGQCLSKFNEAATRPVWQSADWGDQGGSSGSNSTVAYGKYTGAPPIAKVAAQPRYIMELLAPEDQSGGSNTQLVAIRVTARAVGQNPNTVVMLQSVVVPK